jgi:hypothetical protein
MLEKVININSNSSVGRERKSSNFSLDTHRHTEFFEQSHDSIVLSPGVAYLNGLGWRIKNIRMPKSDKVLIEFLYGDLQFQAELGMIYNKKLNQQPISIIQDSFELNHKIKTLAIVTINRDLLFEDFEFRFIKLNGISEFFQRIKDFNIETNFSHMDINVIEKLLSGLENRILFELTNINTAFINYLIKLCNFSIYPTDSDSMEKPLLKIEKIVTTKMN